MSSPAAPLCALPPRQAEVLRLGCFVLMVANVAAMAGILMQGGWILGPDGLPIHTDFTMVYAAGKLVLAGDPAAAWDWAVHSKAEDAVIGRPADGYLAWHYPPPFLMVAGALALLPYWAAFLSWIAVTLPLYLATIRTIVGDRVGWLAAAAMPVLAPNLVSGQNGFLTAALIGGSLWWLDRRPVLSGILLGFLTYKPQYGVLFPLLLLVTGRWRVIAAAAATVLALGAATVLLFGPESWAAFLHWLPRTSQRLLSGDETDWRKFQSVLALVRLLGGGATLAWTLQLVVAAVTAAVLVVLWRSRRASADMKAAALGLGVMLATPYIYLYDLAVLAVPAAFLLRSALATGFMPGEAIGLGVMIAALTVLPVLTIPPGLIGVAVIGVLIARRVLARPR